MRGNSQFCLCGALECKRLPPSSISLTVSTQPPQPVPAPQSSPTASTVFAPARRQLLTSDSVTAMHMHTYMLSPLQWKLIGKAKESMWPLTRARVSGHTESVPLEEYRRKRNRGRTPEPIPSEGPQTDANTTDSAHSIFVIQEHHARRLHWDLRLERDGVLASWAVPRGLPTDSDTVRLAVRTEDHPMEYAEFSGQIPAGEYGAGHMTIWDRGTYETIKWADHEVQVVLHGQKVDGQYVLLQRGSEPKSWLLRRMGSAPEPGLAPLPYDVSPMVARDGRVPDDDAEWCYEVHFGGTRVTARVESGRVRLVDAGGRDLTARHPEVGGLGSALGSTRALLDGEIGGTPPGLWITDLLHLDGRDCTPLPYTARRELLDSLPLTGPHWRPAPSYPGGGSAVLDAAAEQGLPAIVAKRADSRYLPGVLTDDWLRIPTGATIAVPDEPARPAVPAAPSATQNTSVAAGGRKVRLTNPEKVLYPESSFRKKDVMAHYLAVADVMLPHLAGRPVTLRRWPDGVDGTPFFEKNVSRHVPDWVRTVRLASPGSSRGTEAIDYPLIDDAAGLAWVANLAALELHVPQWVVGPRGGRQPPDLLVFDLDPGDGATIVDCARVALRLSEVLAEDGLTGYPRTSGGKGMQMYAAVTVSDAEQTAAYAKLLAEQLTTEDPSRVLAVMARQRRKGKVFIDWSQNNAAKTTVASYSLRGRELPTVATPVTWDEVRACRRPEDLRFTAHDLPDRLSTYGDLMAPLLGPGDPLPAAGPRARG